MVFNLRPVVMKDLLTKRIDLALEHDLHPGLLQPDVDASDPAKKGRDPEGRPRFLYFPGTGVRQAIVGPNDCSRFVWFH